LILWEYSFDLIEPANTEFLQCEKGNFMPLLLPSRDSLQFSIDDGTEEDYHLIQLYYSWYAGWFYRHRLKMVSNLLDGKSFDKLLEIGTGSGIFILELSKHANLVVGMDIHPGYHGVQKMLEREGADLSRVELRQGDIFDIPYPDHSFDAVVCVSVLEHFPEPRPALDEIRRIVRPRCPIVMGFPADTMITRLIFASLGCNVQEIHPASHSTILAAIEDVLSIDKLSFFPWARIPLYIACRAYAT
jgi:SAM-dependent methyltransferase